MEHQRHRLSRGYLLRDTRKSANVARWPQSLFMKVYLAFGLVFFSCICQSENVECYDNASTTKAADACTAAEVEGATALLEKYLSAAKKRYSSDKPVVTSINRGQTAWISYKNAHCDSVYEMYREGSIRGAMHLGCQLQLTMERTHAVWQDYLTSWDSTPPLLPEPKK